MNRCYDYGALQCCRFLARRRCNGVPEFDKQNVLVESIEGHCLSKASHVFCCGYCLGPYQPRPVRVKKFRSSHWTKEIKIKMKRTVSLDFWIPGIGGTVLVSVSELVTLVFYAAVRNDYGWRHCRYR